MTNQNNNQQDQEPRKQLNTFSRFSGLALQMFVIIGIGTYLGVKLDEKFPNKHNLYTVSLSLISVIMAIFFVIKRIIAASKNDNQ